MTGLAASSEANTGDKRTECNTEDTYECGNIEISACAQCVCGDNTFSEEDYFDDDKRCCPAPREECQTNDEGDGVCNNGIMINAFYQSCDYAHFSCDNRTVNKYEMCHGYTLCQDGTDLEQCSALTCDTSRNGYDMDLTRQVLLVKRHVEHLRTLLTENVTRLARAMMVLTIVSTGEMKKVLPEIRLSVLISQSSRSALSMVTMV